jgi:hypothetical protein
LLQVQAHPSSCWLWGFAGPFQDTRVDAAGNALPLTGDAIVPFFGSNWKLYEYTASPERRLLYFKMAWRSTAAGCLATAEAGAALALCLPHLALMHHNAVTSAVAVCVGLLSHCC